MKVKIITAFPEFVESIKEFSIIRRAIQKKALSIEVYNLRDWGLGKYKQIDDTPFGAGVGMLLRIEPIDNAINAVRTEKSYVVATSAKGNILNYRKSTELSKKKELVIVCGHYEGIDHRVYEQLVDESISIGNFVLSGGELAAMVVVDSVTRLLPGVINKKSLLEESNEKYNEYPQYTKPRAYKGLKVPDVLISGNHQEIAKWKDSNKILK